MNKKSLAVLVVGLCMTATFAFADQDYQQRNVFNKVSDWSATMFKSPTEKQQIIDQRVDERAEKREAAVTYKKRKAELNSDYRNELLTISNNDTYSAQEMADKLKAAYADHKVKLDRLKEDARN